MLFQRIVTALVGIPVIMALVLIGGGVYAIAAAIILVLANLEFYAATDPETAATSPAHPRLRRSAPSLFGQRTPAFAGCAAVLLLVGLRDWLWVTGGVTYIGFLGGHLVLLRDLDDDGDWVFVAVFATFAADTAAYFAGRAFGRRQLSPAISPGKTIEGGIAGIVVGFAAVFVVAWVVGLDVDEMELAPLALLLPIVAIVGDLAESLIKRGAGIKDSSELVPGHGGFLDRMDAILFTVPLVFYYAMWVFY